MTHARSPAPSADQRAVIDIGSNTVRRVIYGGPHRSPEVLLNEKVTARLGRGLADGGTLAPAARQTALAALRRYAGLLELRGITCVRTVATAAARDASDGAAFLDEVRQTGLEPRLLSGEEEALKSALGVVAAFPRACGIVVDLGGGSLELVHVNGLEREHGVSLPLGSLRLSKLREGGNDKFVRRVGKLMTGSGWNGTTAQPLYLVGGSFRAFARYAMVKTDWPIDDPHGFELTPELARNLCQRIAHTRQFPQIPDISSSRLASLPDTAALLSALISRIAPTRIVFSSWGLREGVLFRDRTDTIESEDPLLAGITAYATANRVDPRIAAAVAQWTGRVAPAFTAGHEPVRQAAIMLALASLRVEPNLRLDAAANWAMRKRWIGIDAQGRALMAACVLANGGVANLPEPLLRLASPESLREATAWGLATRLCRRFTGLAAPALDASNLETRGQTTILGIDPAIASLANAACEKDLKRLAQHLGTQARVAIREP